MTEAEIEKQAEEYAVDKLGEQEHQLFKEGVASYIAWKTAEVEQAFKDGAKWGAEHATEWHDLRKDPNDLPEEGKEVLVLYTNTFGNGEYIVNKGTLRYELAQYINDEEDTSEWYWVETGTDYDIQKVIKWCELPRFKEEEE